MNESQSAPTEAQNTEALLQRVLAAVEKDNRRGRLELALAIILSLATLASTWCGYQARQWGGVQSNKQSAADTAERQAAEDTIVALQLRTFDGIVMIEYWAALRQRDKETGDAIYAQMRPQLRKAIDASLAAGVLTNPEVAGPLQRPEYILAEEQSAKHLREEAGKLNIAAQTAGQACSKYVLLTLMFASVLFFGGITGTFTARQVRNGLGCVALLVFIVTIAFLIELPVCKG
ncbi:MAG: hypothetical protein HY287_06505 [Planctomycetes bacterium]|nr:hypothetical protein [Planctomycetota bacterium]MBI3833964.1 hypothetical protein [Planctomycetota bacterium]